MKGRRNGVDALNPGEYVCNVVSIRQGQDPLQLVLTIEMVEQMPEGHYKFYVFNKEQKIYTVLTAKNIHHAGNKAAKLYGDSFTGITRETPTATQWRFRTIKKFGEAVRKAL